MSTNQLKVIGAGLGRTGTESLKMALEQLGFGTGYHNISRRDAEARRKKPLRPCVSARDFLAHCTRIWLLSA